MLEYGILGPRVQCPRPPPQKTTPDYGMFRPITSNYGIFRHLTAFQDILVRFSAVLASEILSDKGIYFLGIDVYLKPGSYCKDWHYDVQVLIN